MSQKSTDLQSSVEMTCPDYGVRWTTSHGGRIHEHSERLTTV